MNLRSITVGGFRLLTQVGKETPVDPVTAINNGIAALFQFLATPQGQLVVADIRALNKDIGSKIADLIDHLHGQATKSDPTPKAA